jgi:hypothetical protein
MSLSRDDKDQLAGMLAAAINKPDYNSLHTKLSTWDIIRKWAWIVILSVGLMITFGIGANQLIIQVKENTARSLDDHRKVQIMWWMKENGLTNHDLKEKNIQPPEF